jgi:hypothetical protein
MRLTCGRARAKANNILQVGCSLNNHFERGYRTCNQYPEYCSAGFVKEAAPGALPGSLPEGHRTDRSSVFFYYELPYEGPLVRPRAPGLKPEIHRVDPESGSTLRLL